MTSLTAAGAPAQANGGEGNPVFSFQDERIDESSGLVDLGSLMVTNNDSGDDGIVYTVDPANGETVGTTRFGSADDAEALAPAGPHAVWFGDTGGNADPRETVSVTRVPVGRGDRTVDPESYRLHYPDGAHDAEALLADPATGRLYVVTKDLFGGRVYAAPKRLRAGSDNPLTALDKVGPLITDGAVFPDGKHVILRGYTSATVYTFPGFEKVDSFRLPQQPQGEAVSVGPGDRVRVGSEGKHSTVLQIELPREVRMALGEVSSPSPAPPTQPGTAGPEPSADDPAGNLADDAHGQTTGGWWFVGGGALVLAAGVLTLRSLRRRRAG